MALKLKTIESPLLQRERSSSPVTEKSKLRKKPVVPFLPQVGTSFTERGRVLESKEVRRKIRLTRLIWHKKNDRLS